MIIYCLASFLIGVIATFYICRWAVRGTADNAQRALRVWNQAHEVERNLKAELRNYKHENIRLTMELKQAHQDEKMIENLSVAVRELKNENGYLRELQGGNGHPKLKSGGSVT